GGGMSAALLVRLRDAKKHLPAGAALICPWVDMTAQGGSLEKNARFDWSPVDVEPTWRKAFLGGHDPTDPLVSPVYADLSRLPPLLVQIGGADLLFSQACKLAERAKSQGTETRLEITKDMVHNWHTFADLIPSCRPAIDAIGAFVR